MTLNALWLHAFFLSPFLGCMAAWLITAMVMHISILLFKHGNCRHQT